MNTGVVEPLFRAESQQIAGAAMEVLNEVGHGFHEKPYENTLVAEFRLRGVPCLHQKKFRMFFKTEKFVEYIPDLIVFDKIISDRKVIERITDLEIVRMLNYLKVTGLRLGCILNFKNTKQERKRLVR